MITFRGRKTFIKLNQFNDIDPLPIRNKGDYGKEQFRFPNLHDYKIKKLISKLEKYTFRSKSVSHKSAKTHRQAELEFLKDLREQQIKKYHFFVQKKEAGLSKDKVSKMRHNSSRISRKYRINL